MTDLLNDDARVTNRAAITAKAGLSGGDNKGHPSIMRGTYYVLESYRSSFRMGETVDLWGFSFTAELEILDLSSSAGR